MWRLPRRNTRRRTVVPYTTIDLGVAAHIAMIVGATTSASGST